MIVEEKTIIARSVTVAPRHGSDSNQLVIGLFDFDILLSVKELTELVVETICKIPEGEIIDMCNEINTAVSDRLQMESCVIKH